MPGQQNLSHAFQIIYALSLTFRGMIMQNGFVLVRKDGAVLSQ